jgi:hypothetical protein
MKSYARRTFERVLRFFRLVWHRHSTSLIPILAVGVCLYAAYKAWTAAYAVCNGFGETILKAGPLLGPGLGVIVFWWQVSRARYSQRIDLIVKMAERFDKPEMRATRARAAKALLHDREARDDSISQVLDFFEDLGFLLTRKAIDDDAVYTFFDYWIVRYFLATDKYRRYLNDGVEPPDLYCKTSTLFGIMADRAGKAPTLADDKLNMFLRDESRLIHDAKVNSSISVIAGRSRSNAGRYK